MEVTIPIQALVELAIIIAGFGVTWGVMRSDVRAMRARLDQIEKDGDRASDAADKCKGLEGRVSHLETHSSKLDQIAPLKAELDGMQLRFAAEVERMREDFRDLSRAVRELSVAVLQSVSTSNGPRQVAK